MLATDSSMLATGGSMMVLGALILIGAAVYGVISNIVSALRRKK